MISQRVLWFAFSLFFGMSSAQAGPKSKSRFSLKRDKEVGALLLKDNKGGLQFAVKRGKLTKIRKPKATEREPAWEAVVVTNRGVAIRFLLEESETPFSSEASDLSAYLQSEADRRKDTDPVVRQYDPVVYGTDLLDSMGIAQAGGDINLIWHQRKKWDAEKVFVIVAGKRRYTISMRYKNRHMKRGHVADVETLFQQELKVRNP